MENPLKDIDGNIMAWMADKSESNALSHKDMYKCDCGELVEDHEWIHELKVCRQCWEDKHGSGYISIAQAEYNKGE